MPVLNDDGLALLATAICAISTVFIAVRKRQHSKILREAELRHHREKAIQALVLQQAKLEDHRNHQIKISVDMSQAEIGLKRLRESIHGTYSLPTAKPKLNCRNCGAKHHPNACDYCGTPN